MPALVVLSVGRDLTKGLKEYKVAQSGQTSKAVLKNAGKIMGLTDYGLDVWLTNNPEEARKVVRSMAASLVSQAPAKVRVDLKAEISKTRRANAKAEREARTAEIEPQAV